MSDKELLLIILGLFLLVASVSGIYIVSLYCVWNFVVADLLDLPNASWFQACIMYLGCILARGVFQSNVTVKS